MNSILVKDPTLTVMLVDALNPQLEFDSSSNWAAITQLVKDKQNLHSSRMKGLAPPLTALSPAPTIKLATHDLPPASDDSTRKLKEFNTFLKGFSNKEINISDWSKIYHAATTDLQSWSLSPDCFTPLGLHKLRDIPLQIYGIEPGTAKTDILAALSPLKVEDGDLQVYLMKSNARSSA
jgi:hypothetical protein